MSAFSPKSSTDTTADPRQRARVRRDRVLELDDLVADWTWLDGRDRWLARELFGSGTVRGLDVSVDSAAQRVFVEPGVALDRAGRLIAVPERQGASLVPWMPSSTRTALYLTLSAASRTAAPLPTPGISCDADEQTEPSRIVDAFELCLQSAPPTSSDEPARLRALIGILKRVEERTQGALPRARWVDAVSEAVAAVLAGGVWTALAVAPGDRSALLGLAPLIWVTRVRGATGAVDARGGADGGVLLARLVIQGDAVTVDSTDRQVVLSNVALRGLAGDMWEEEGEETEVEEEMGDNGTDLANRLSALERDLDMAEAYVRSAWDAVHIDRQVTRESLLDLRDALQTTLASIQQDLKGFPETDAPDPLPPVGFGDDIKVFQNFVRDMAGPTNEEMAGILTMDELVSDLTGAWADRVVVDAARALRDLRDRCELNLGVDLDDLLRGLWAKWEPTWALLTTDEQKAAQARTGPLSLALEAPLNLASPTAATGSTGLQDRIAAAESALAWLTTEAKAVSENPPTGYRFSRITLTFMTNAKTDMAAARHTATGLTQGGRERAPISYDGLSNEMATELSANYRSGALVPGLYATDESLAVSAIQRGFDSAWLDTHSAQFAVTCKEAIRARLRVDWGEDWEDHVGLLCRAIAVGEVITGTTAGEAWSSEPAITPEREDGSGYPVTFGSDPELSDRVERMEKRWVKLESDLIQLRAIQPAVLDSSFVQSTSADIKAAVFEAEGRVRQAAGGEFYVLAPAISSQTAVTLKAAFADYVAGNLPSRQDTYDQGIQRKDWPNKRTAWLEANQASADDALADRRAATVDEVLGTALSKILATHSLTRAMGSAMGLGTLSTTWDRIQATITALGTAIKTIWKLKGLTEEPAGSRPRTTPRVFGLSFRDTGEHPLMPASASPALLAMRFTWDGAPAVSGYDSIRVAPVGPGTDDQQHLLVETIYDADGAAVSATPITGAEDSPWFVEQLDAAHASSQFPELASALSNGATLLRFTALRPATRPPAGVSVQVTSLSGGSS